VAPDDTQDKRPTERPEETAEVGPVQRRARPRAAQRPHRGRGSLLFFWVSLVLVVLVGAVVLYQRVRGPGGAGTDQTGPLEAQPETGTGDRAVVLVFPNWDGTGYVSEERQLPSRDRLEDDLLAVMGALCAGPTASGAVSAIPKGTRPLAAFYDEKNGSVVLDFSRELVVNHEGGSAAENATLETILKTIALNFPEVQLCTLLVDGAQSETLAGHLTLDQPFQPRRWL
jgi:germination protein M